MAGGGRRPGAGRPKGAISKSTRALIELAEAAKANGETPLQYMLRIMRNTKVPAARRDEMAKAAAPYVHARLASTEISGPGGGPIKTDGAAKRIMSKLAAIADKANKK